MNLLRLIPLLLLCLAAPAHAADTVVNEHTTLSLISEKQAIDANSKEGFKVALKLQAKEGWHTYWENPGDAGLATTLSWNLPQGFTAGAVDWPAPIRLNEGPLTIYAYEGTTILPVTITAPSSIVATEIPLKLHVDLLVCKDICIPESADLDLTLPTTNEPVKPTLNTELFHPNNTSYVAPVRQSGHFTHDHNVITLSLNLDTLPNGGAPIAFEKIHDTQFFPRDQNIFQYSAPQTTSGDDKTLNITIPKTEDAAPPSRLSGILTLTLSNGNKSFNVTFDNGISAPTNTVENTNIIFPVAIILAIIGGLVLNLMPCVLPVLSLKALALAKKSSHSQQLVIRQGVAYALGIAASFALISGILLSLRAGGEAVGWGYQMQSPPFVAALSYLLFIVGLSLSGMFHLPVLLGGIGNQQGNESSTKGSFLTGILATAVATPCTAPFMAPAVGAALTMPAWQSLLVFQALGFGLSLPYLLICIFPALRGFLPKPGAWMQTFKELMAFPMYASVIWLLWVLTLQTGIGGMVVALSSLLFLVIIIWSRRFFASGSRVYLVGMVSATLLTLSISLYMLSQLETSAIMEQPAAAAHITTVPYSKSALEELRAKGAPVYVDATAAWCITCQVNTSVALHTTRTMQAFKDNDITLMIADWTRRNDEITSFLAQFGFNGVPLNVYYPPDHAEPVILPQILSEDLVIKTITQKGK